MENIVSKYFSGLWEGKSVSSAGDCTKWTKTFLLFLPTENKRKLMVEGRGISEWRGQHIVFLISGEIDISEDIFSSSEDVSDGTKPWPSVFFNIKKQHTGKFTNALNFMGKLDAPVQGSHVALQGRYQSGLLNLRRIGDVSSLVRYWRCFHEEKLVKWNEMHLRFLDFCRVVGSEDLFRQRT